MEATNLLFGITISEKLSKNNHAIWKAQVLTTVQGARLMGHLTGVTKAPEEHIVSKSGNEEVKASNPEYESWYAIDQQVLGFLLSSLSREALLPVAGKQRWRRHGLRSSRCLLLRLVRLALTTAQKGSQSITEYVGRMRALGDR